MATPNTWQGWVLTIVGVASLLGWHSALFVRQIGMLVALAAAAVLRLLKTGGGGAGWKSTIFKIMPRAEWGRADAYEGSAHDRADGFLHFSTGPQLPETLRRYYARPETISCWSRRIPSRAGQRLEVGTFPFAWRGFSASLCGVLLISADVRRVQAAFTERRRAAGLPVLPRMSQYVNRRRRV